MASKAVSTFSIFPNIFMKGKLKVAGNIELGTDYVGSIQASHEVLLLSGVRVESDVTSGSLRVERGALLVGKLQIGEARKPFSRLRSWFGGVKASVAPSRTVE